MGRLFERECAYLNETYREMQNVDISEIEKFLAVDAMLLIVGSGGSFSAAKAIEYQCDRIGQCAKAITPLQLEEHRNVIYKTKVILLTARGNNQDILKAYRFCEKWEALAILGICMSTKSKLHREFRKNGHQFLWERDMSFGKDGYLSVNSLIAMIVVMSQAIYRYSGDSFFLLPQEKQIEVSKERIEKYIGLELFEKDTIIVLHGGSTTQVAVDLESKFSEVALGNVQIVDFRNLAHGRHYWLEERKESTGIIAFVSPDLSEVAEKTLACVPEEIPVQPVYMNTNDNFSIIDLFTEMFCIVYAAGVKKGINPGKPKVPAYGKQMYHDNGTCWDMELVKKIDRNIAMRAAYRKAETVIKGDKLFQYYLQSATAYINDMKRKDWKCLVFDYDGTLHWKGNETDTENKIFDLINSLLSQGVMIAVATGRGKSVRKELQEKIKTEFWGHVGIGYYNGGVFGWLNDDTLPQGVCGKIEDIEILYQTLHEDAVLSKYYAELEAPKAKQWTLAVHPMAGSRYVLQILKESVYFKRGLKMVASSHSTDIIPKTTSKENTIDGFSEFGIKIKDCLFIGDAGTYEGNDFEMLANISLSVDRVSKSPESCWNFAPLGKRQLDATLFYLEHIKVNKAGRVEICFR